MQQPSKLLLLPTLRLGEQRHPQHCADENCVILQIGPVPRFGALPEGVIHPLLSCGKLVQDGLDLLNCITV